MEGTCVVVDSYTGDGKDMCSGRQLYRRWKGHVYCVVVDSSTGDGKEMYSGRQLYRR